MADEVSIDKTQFHERLSAFIAQWKTDKRSGDQLYNGAGSVTIVMGKSEEAQGYNKASAMQVSALKIKLDRWDSWRRHCGRNHEVPVCVYF